MRVFTTRYIFCLLAVFLIVPFGWSQNGILIFNEDFETGANAFIADSSFGIPQGINSWIKNNEYSGNGIYPNTTSQTNTISGTIGNPNGYYLHISDTTQLSNVANANYDPNSASDHFVVLDQGFCTLGFDSIEFSFFYVCEGSTNAYAEVYYSIDGGNWISSGNQYNNQNLWKNERITNPAFSDVFDLRFGFRWVNTSSVSINAISFGVDDIFIVGYFTQTSSPIDIHVTYLSNSVVCQGNYLVFRYEISDTLCGGQYLIELSDVNGNFANPTALWTTSMFYPNTSSTLMIQIPNWATVSTCYKLRVNRISPSPQIIGIASVCFEVAICPNTIITGPTPPVVTMDTADVCIGSVIDIPFFAIGVYLSGNIFSAYLSDSTGSFANPSYIGQLPSNQTFDPNIFPGLPGNVSGIIPNVPAGCNYYIKISSSVPIANDTSTWGPFCIKNCDIETNNRQDLQFCITDTTGDSTLIPIDVNFPPSNVIYYPGNEFQVELLNSMFFFRVNLGGLGSIIATNDTSIWVVVPDFITLSAMGIQPGMYYMRIVATNSNTPGNQLGTLIRLTIGHPATNPLPGILATDSLVCHGDAATLWVAPTQPGSKYLWRLNGQIWPAISTGLNPANSVGALFNGGAGNYNFTIQETNFGCIGIVSSPFTIKLLNPPSIYVVPNAPVCFADTVGYFVQFSPNTYYSWTAPTCGQMLDTTNNQMTVAWNQTTGPCNLQVYAINKCGSNIGSTTITINPLPNAFAGNDTNICKGDSIQLSASGGNNYIWSPTNTLQNANTSTPIAFPTNTLDYIVQVTNNYNCRNYDTILVIVNSVPSFNAGLNQNIICGDSVFLNATQINSAIYTWLPDTNISDNTTYNPTAYPIKTTNYRITVMTIEGCDLKDSLLITVKNMLVNAGNDTTLCKEESIILGGNPTAVQGSIFSWTPTSSLDNPTKANPVATPSTNTDYIINVSNQLGCQNVDTINIEIISLPSTDTVLEICEGFNLVLTPSNNNAIYNWTTGQTTEQIVVSDLGLYAVEIHTQEGCLITDSFLVILNDCEYFFFTPNSFTPNGDNKNDLFLPVTDGIDSLHFMIFNRWGEKIFESTDFTPWNGTYNNNPAPIGIYTWTAYYLGKGKFGQEEKSEQGTFSLIR